MTNIRLLLVDDSNIVRMVIAKQLEVLGLITDTAADGLLAVEAVKANDYDLIFMDVMMPNLDGMEATKQIRELEAEQVKARGENPDKKRTVIVGVTGYTNRSDCLNAGMDDFLFKPVTIQQLKEAIERWCPQATFKGSAALSQN